MGADAATIGPVRPLAGAPTRDGDVATPLVCLPYAGGGLAAFRQWRCGPGVAPVGVQLPGREDRLREPPFERMGPLVEWLGEVLAPYLGRPFALFGHSMGARIAFAFAHWLAERGEPGPVALFVSGSPGPCLRTPVGGWNESDDGLVRWLRRMDGTPQEILDHPGILEMLLPTLRADLTVVATQPYLDAPPLACPIHAFAGARDDYASPARMSRWRRETRGGFRLTTLPGGHFFLHDQLPALLAAIARDLARLTSAEVRR